MRLVVHFERCVCTIKSHTDILLLTPFEESATDLTRKPKANCVAGVTRSHAIPAQCCSPTRAAPERVRARIAHRWRKMNDSDQVLVQVCLTLRDGCAKGILKVVATTPNSEAATQFIRCSDSVSASPTSQVLL